MHRTLRDRQASQAFWLRPDLPLAAVLEGVAAFGEWASMA